MQKNEHGIEEVSSGPALIVTDMPGFGFAFMSETDQLRTSEISKLYLTERGPNLKRVLLLLDSRHGLKIGDEKFFKDLFSKTSIEEGRKQTLYPGDKDSLVKWKLQIVLTKCDLVERFELVRRIQVLKDKISEILPNIGYTSLPILAISSIENRGVLELKKDLASLIVRDSRFIKIDNDISNKPSSKVDTFSEEFIEGNEDENVRTKRTWKPKVDPKKLQELDRSFTVKGKSVDHALGLKDSTRHKVAVGKGTWSSSNRSLEIATDADNKYIENETENTTPDKNRKDRTKSTTSDTKSKVDKNESSNVNWLGNFNPESKIFTDYDKKHNIDSDYDYDDTIPDININMKNERKNTDNTNSNKKRDNDASKKTSNQTRLNLINSGNLNILESPLNFFNKTNKIVDTTNSTSPGIYLVLLL
jgi:GTP-binding protein EngB required for normal cell division